MKYTSLLLMLSCLTLIRVEGQAVRASRAAQPGGAAVVALGPTGFWQLMRVRRMVDADTYEMNLPAGTVARVRLLGVDAPESSQPYGRQATEQVAALMQGRLLRGRVLEVRRGESDRYGRNLAGLRVAVATAGTTRWLRVDSIMVVRGWAWAYEPGRTVAALAGLQELAQRKRRGLWRCGSAAVVRPGVWRALNKQEKAGAWSGCTW